MFTPVPAVVVALGVYLVTLCPTVYFLDGGELIAAAWTGGISHPPGQPLWSLTGWFWAHSVPIGSVAWRLNLLSAILASASAWLVARLCAEIARMAVPGLDPAVRGVVAWGAAALHALSGTTWLYATVAEVYALHELLLAAALLAGLRAAAQIVPRRGPQAPGLVGLLLGLGWTNHGSIVLVMPAMAVWGLRSLGVRGLAGRLPYVGAGCALGLLPLLYLPIRSSADPPLDWGNTESLDGFLRHVSAWQYRVYLSNYLESVPNGLIFYFKHIMWDDTPFWLLPVAVVGAARTTLRVRGGIGAGLAFLFILGVVLPAGYGTTEQRPYFATAGMVMALWCSVGLAQLAGWVGIDHRRRLPWMFAGILVSIAAFAGYRWDRFDRSRMTLARDVAGEILAALPPRSALVTEDWELVYAPALYLQLAEGVRPDVVLIDGLLFKRGWYVDDVVRRIGGVPPAMAGLFREYRHGVGRFEAGEPVDGRRMDELQTVVLRGILRHLGERGGAAATPEAVRWIPEGWAQDGFVLAWPAGARRGVSGIWVQRLAAERLVDPFAGRLFRLAASAERLGISRD